VEYISVLHPRDIAEFDEDTINALSREVGQNVAENILCRALEDMAARLAQIRSDYVDGHRSRLRKSVRALVPIAEQVGLPIVAKVARDVISCIDSDEGVALAATLCRLLRCGETAIACADMDHEFSL
jgi:hypothetical protein